MHIVPRRTCAENRDAAELAIVGADSLVTRVLGRGHLHALVRQQRERVLDEQPHQTLGIEDELVTIRPVVPARGNRSGRSG